jgi:hypothetical protein
MRIDTTMTANVSSPTRLFTVREANAALPLVRAITQDLVRDASDLVDRRDRLQVLLAGRRLTVGNPYDDELAQMGEDLERDANRIREYIEELEQLGVELKSATDGLVDFPGILEGRHVYFCWKLGESEVSHWHEIDAGFARENRWHRSRRATKLPREARSSADANSRS